MFKVGKPASTYEKIGDKWEYNFTLDTTTADIIRVGRSIDYEEDPELPDAIRYTDGWDSSGFLYAEGFSKRDAHSKLKIQTTWLPGPISVYFATEEAALEPYEMYGDDLENMAAIERGGIFKSSVRRLVIGPAIEPGTSPRTMLALIRNWYDEGNHFLEPLTKDGLDILAELDKLKPSEGYEQNVLDCIKAALEAK